MTALKVLDKGYVSLENVMGDDLSVVNAAKASYAKKSDNFGPAEERLITFLAREGHTSPFRHAMLTFEVKAPLMVARQWWKYVVGSDHTMDSWNEASRRYITMEPEFYIPEVWRKAPENSKQGSGKDFDEIASESFNRDLKDNIATALEDYNWALKKGAAPEQARLFLPAYAMYTNWWWTCSLQSCLHFLAQRLEDDAQFEIQEYAKAVYELTKDKFPKTFEVWFN